MGAKKLRWGRVLVLRLERPGNVGHEQRRQHGEQNARENARDEESGAQHSGAHRILRLHHSEKSKNNRSII